MSTVFLYTPHPDDETLSMGLAATYYLSLGYEVHFVFMSPGGSTSARDKVNNGYNCQFHGHVHNCAQEGYPADLTMDQVGVIRLNEGKSAVGAMGTVSNAGQVIVHEEKAFSTYPDFAYFGGTDWQNPINVDVVQAIMKGYIDAYPGSIHHTMSDLDRHADHACLGHALRNLKNDPAYSAKLAGSRFFISRLYWSTTDYPDIAAKPGYTWVSSMIKSGRTTADYSAKMAECTAVLRNRVGPMYYAWNPAAMSLAIGAHSVQGQFESNGLVPGSTVAIDNKWHL
jgi:LmbE family N-acetylglucosaminyl deacetylase